MGLVSRSLLQHHDSFALGRGLWKRWKKEKKEGTLFWGGKKGEKGRDEKKNERKSTKEIFSDVPNNEEFINNFYNRLSRSLSILINTIDPDVIVFGGGVSNEIKDLNLVKKMTANFSGNLNIKTSFIKPKYGDASGVRGAAILGRQNSI